jgi:CRISPR-associated protein Csd1
LTPNKSRIAVSLWQESKMGDFASKIERYFNDFEITHGPAESESLSLLQVVTATALKDDKKNVAPNLTANLLRSIVTSVSYPQQLYNQTMVRVRAEQGPRRKHAAVIKAYLNRNHKGGFTVMLDEERQDRAYRLGRAFAVFEKTQKDALGEKNSTVRDRYYGAASTSPATVFSRLMNLYGNHLKKLSQTKPGLAVDRDKLLQYILAKVDEFPSQLDLLEQGKFALGYYHQKQDFYTKKDDSADEVEESEQA